MIRVYSIKDDSSQTFQGAYLYANDALASRDFKALGQDGKLGLIGRFPADFHLYNIGTFDELTGKIESQITLVANFSDILGAQDASR